MTGQPSVVEVLVAVEDTASEEACRVYPDDYPAAALYGGVVDTHREAYTSGYLSGYAAAGLLASGPTPINLLRELIDEDDCWFDHHGGCQAHGHLSLKPGETCPQQDAKDVIARADQTETKEDDRG